MKSETIRDRAAITVLSPANSRVPRISIMNDLAVNSIPLIRIHRKTCKGVVMSYMTTFIVCMMLLRPPGV